MYWRCFWYPSHILGPRNSTICNWRNDVPHSFWPKKTSVLNSERHIKNYLQSAVFCETVNIIVLVRPFTSRSDALKTATLMPYTVFTFKNKHETQQKTENFTHLTCAPQSNLQKGQVVMFCVAYMSTSPSKGTVRGLMVEKWKIEKKIVNGPKQSLMKTFCTRALFSPFCLVSYL